MKPFAVIDISTLGLSIDNLKVDLDKKESYIKRLGVALGYSDDEEYISYMVTFSIEEEEDKLFEITIGLMIELADYSVVSNKGEDGSFTLPSDLNELILDHVFAICLGVISTKTEGLKIAEIVNFPLYDPSFLQPL